MNRPNTEVEFLAWAAATISADFGDAARRYYDLNSSQALLAVQDHEFFKGLSVVLNELEDAAIAEGSSRILMTNQELRLVKKSYQSVVNKAFRLNVVWNRRFPQAPKEGWVKPENLVSRLDDIVRCTIVCKFIDQPRVLAESLEQYAKSLGLKARFKGQGLDEGYYAYHLYVSIPITWVDQSLQNEQTVELEVELQITTQLQEIMYGITHQFYEARRVLREEDPGSWKWDVKSNRFRAGYVSHTLHLLEAIILDLRDSESTDDSARGDGDE